MKITLAPTKTIIQEKCMWKHVTCLSIFDSLNLTLLLSPTVFSFSSCRFLWNTPLLFICPSLSLSFHIWPCLFLFPPLLFLFGRFNAFTPPLHSCGCFIHQSQHYLTNPTASSFAPLHLPLHHPPWTHGLSLEACTLPDTLLLSSLWLSPWRSHSYSYFGDLLWDLIVQRIHTYIYTHIRTMDLGEVINSLEMLGFSFFF